MKILLVGDYPDDARLGSAKVFYKLREEFQNLGHTCDALFSRDIGARPNNRFIRQTFASTLAARAIARAFRKRGPYDVVDIASAEGFIFGAQRRAGAYGKTAFICRSNGLEHLNYERMLDDHRAGLSHKPWTRRIWYPLMRMSQVAAAARLADKLIVLNEVDRSFAAERRWKPSSDIKIVPHGISDRFLYNATRAESERGGGILFCGTWDKTKGIDYLVSAFQLLLSRGPQVNLTILGGGVPETVIRSAFSGDAQKHLTVMERAPEEEVIRQYRRHDAFVLSSTYEGFGMVLLEAMSQKLPVVSTPVGCAAMLIRDTETGLLVPSRNPEALADAIGQLLSNSDMRARLAANAYKQVREMTWRKTAINTLDIYKQALTPLFGFESEIVRSRG
ncbi:MAG: glycosyltransferase family 4 protein [Blastocatellia bacterium]